jgi:hypothetical protein
MPGDRAWRLGGEARQLIGEMTLEPQVDNAQSGVRGMPNGAE